MRSTRRAHLDWELELTYDTQYSLLPSQLLPRAGRHPGARHGQGSSKGRQAMYAKLCTSSEINSSLDRSSLVM